MIRRDYILRMVEEFVRAVARIQELKKKQSWGEARSEIEKELKQLFGGSIKEIEKLSETEILGKLIASDSAFIVKEKATILATLLKESGDVAIGNGDVEKGRALHLKGFNLLLGLLNRGDIYDVPEYSPSVETFLQALGDDPLPLDTLAKLMQYFERTGNFARAEDVLFEIAEAGDFQAELRRFGVSFYERLLARTDEQLQSGGLPREEVESGLEEFKNRIVG